MTTPSETKLLEAKDKLAEENVWLRTQLDELLAQKFSVKNQSEILVKRLESFEKSAEAEKASLQEHIKELEHKLRGQAQEVETHMVAKTQAGGEAEPKEPFVEEAIKPEANPRIVELEAEIEQLKSQLNKPGGSETNVQALEKQNSDLMAALSKEKAMVQSLEDKITASTSQTNAHGAPKSVEEELTDYKEKCKSWEAKYTKQMEQSSEELKKLQMGATQSAEANAETQMLVLSMQKELEKLQVECKNHAAEAEQAPLLRSTIAEQGTKIMVLQSQLDTGAPEIKPVQHSASNVKAPPGGAPAMSGVRLRIRAVIEQALASQTSSPAVTEATGGNHRVTWLENKLQQQVEQSLKLEEQLRWLEAELVSGAEDEAQQNYILARVAARKWVSAAVFAEPSDKKAMVDARIREEELLDARQQQRDSRLEEDLLDARKRAEYLDEQLQAVTAKAETASQRIVVLEGKLEKMTVANSGSHDGIRIGMLEDRLQTEQNRSASLEEQMCFLEEQLVASAGSSEAKGQILASVSARKVVQAALGSIATTSIKERDRIKAELVIANEKAQHASERLVELEVKLNVGPEGAADAAAPHYVTALEERLQKELSHSKDLEDQMWYLEDHLSAAMGDKDKDFILAQVAARKAVSTAIGTFAIAAGDERDSMQMQLQSATKRAAALKWQLVTSETKAQSATQQLKAYEMQGGSGGPGSQELEARLRKELESRTELEEQMSWLEEQLVASAGQSQADRQSMLAGVAARKVVSVAVGSVAVATSAENERIKEQLRDVKEHSHDLEEEVKFANQKAQAGEHRIKWLEERLKKEVDRTMKREEEMRFLEEQLVAPAGNCEAEQNRILASAAARQAVSTAVGSVAAEVTQECHKMRQELLDAKKYAAGLDGQLTAANAKAEVASQRVMQLESQAEKMREELRAPQELRATGGNAALQQGQVDGLSGTDFYHELKAVNQHSKELAEQTSMMQDAIFKIKTMNPASEKVLEAELEPFRQVHLQVNKKLAELSSSASELERGYAQSQGTYMQLQADHVRVQAECEQFKKALETQRWNFEQERNALWEELNARKLKATSSEMPLKTSDIAKSAQTAPTAQSSLSAQPVQSGAALFSPRPINGSAVRVVPTARESSHSPLPVTRLISAPSGYPTTATPTVVAPDTFVSFVAGQRMVPPQMRAASPLRASPSFSMTPGSPGSPRVMYRTMPPHANMSPVRGAVPTQSAGPVVVTPQSIHRAVRAPGVALS